MKLPPIVNLLLFAFLGMALGYLGSVVIIHGGLWLGSMFHRNIEAVIFRRFGAEFSYLPLAILFLFMLAGGVSGIRFARRWQPAIEPVVTKHPLD